MKYTESKSKTYAEDQAIKEFFNFDLAQESYQSIFGRKEGLRLLVDRNLPPSKLQTILRLAITSNASELVKVLVEEKGVILDTDTLHYALVNVELSAEFSKLNREYSIKILKYLMRKIHYMKAELDSPQEKLDLQEKQEGFIQALRESQCIYISNSIWNKDKQSIEFKNTCFLEREVIKAMKNCQEFIADTNTSTLTIYEVAKNRLIALSYLEKYSEIAKAEKINGYNKLFYCLEGEYPSIQLATLQLLDFCIDRTEYPLFLVDRILKREIENATAMKALLGCRDVNGQLMLGGKAQNKEWCINFYRAISHRKVEDVANLLDVNYKDQEYTSHQARMLICKFLKKRLSLEASESSRTDKKEKVKTFLKSDSTPSVSSFAKTKSLSPFEILDFDLAQEKYQSILDRKEALQLSVDRNQPLSELLDILRLAIRSNALELVKFLVEAKGITPDIDTLHYALVNVGLSAEFSKLDREYSMRILKYLMQKIHYMKAELDSPQEKLDLQEKQEGFMQALRESQCTYIRSSIWNKDKQNIEFENTGFLVLEKSLLKEINNCQGFSVETNTSALTLYAVVKNRLIASAHLEKYSEIAKTGEIKMWVYIVTRCPSSIQLMVLQLLDFFIYQEQYPGFLVEMIVQGEIENATAMQALLGCRNENGQVMLGIKAQDKEWCINLYSAIHCHNIKSIESIANLLDLNYDKIKTLPKKDGQGAYFLGRISIRIFIKEQLLLVKTTSASAKISQADKKEEAGLFLKPDSTPSVSSLVEGRSL
jgi:hypothetical protein